MFCKSVFYVTLMAIAWSAPYVMSAESTALSELMSKYLGNRGHPIMSLVPQSDIQNRHQIYCSNLKEFFNEQEYDWIDFKNYAQEELKDMISKNFQIDPALLDD